ncbi:phosphoglycerate dehydrogenase [Desulfonatronovibrio magnus]|uniref:phosphoglycerate dehydrogenase n=1 Tax=Desulfonatronovibrio magnus TaxID=698827 RepID=UPI0005EBE530|nr:phosphoglycerate dehydrogenase [Desulfonatronovibrio magnus]
MSNILITTSSFAKNDPGPLKIIEQTGLNVVLNPLERKLTEQEVLDLILEHKPIAILAGVEPLTASVLQQATGLKAIARAGIGMDSVDLDTAKQLYISVTNTPDAPTIPVAELTVGMILTLLRQVHTSDASIRQSQWTRPMGQLLYGKTVGLIGCGRIGSKLALYLKNFGCTVVGTDPACKTHEDIQMAELEEVLSVSDIVSLHLPYSTDTHHFINQERLKKFKPGSFLINTARGGLVDEDALHDALVNKQLAGTALDCFENEPYTGPLKKFDNVLLTAHIGSYAKEARIMMETQAANNLISQLKKAGVL